MPDLEKLLDEMVEEGLIGVRDGKYFITKKGLDYIGKQARTSMEALTTMMHTLLMMDEKKIKDRLMLAVSYAMTVLEAVKEFKLDIDNVIEALKLMREALK